MHESLHANNTASQKKDQDPEDKTSFSCVFFCAEFENSRSKN